MSFELLLGDCIQVMRGLPANSVQCCVTSPPYYGLRDYGTAQWEGGDAACDHIAPPSGGRGSSTLKSGGRRIDQQIGLEETPDAYVAKLVDVFREVRRVLHPSGVVFLNLGDSYAGSNGTQGGDGTRSGLRNDGRKEAGRINSNV